jgi:single-strand DNA-binding protein
MSTYQHVVICGNVGRDTEIKYLQDGTAVANTSVAVSKVSGRGENRTESTTWFKVTFWRDAAENASQYLKKGDKVLIVGEVSATAYIDKAGRAVATLEITAREWRKLNARESDGEKANTGDRNPPGGNRSRQPVEPDDIPF